jgi:hypothetical protein
MATVGVAPAAGSKPFLLDFATTASYIDLSAFTTPPPASGCNAQQTGQQCMFAGFLFFGNWGQVTLITTNFGEGTKGPGGIIGTDFLSVHRYALDYVGAQIFEGSDTSFCTDSELTGAGFAPLSTAGFFESNLGLLAPLSSVDSSGQRGFSVPDVPTVGVGVGGVRGLAQLDTGFDDAAVHHSVNVNEAYFSAVQAAAPNALVRLPQYDLTLSTCAGVSEPVSAYGFGPGSSFTFISDDSSIVRSFSDAVIFVKHTPMAALMCGGIGTWTVPAAQVGSSFFPDVGALVFDPISARVWMPRGQ